MDVKKMITQEKRERTVDLIAAGLWTACLVAALLTGVPILIAAGGLGLGMRIRSVVDRGRVLIYMDAISKHEAVVEYLLAKIDGTIPPGSQDGSMDLEQLQATPKKDRS